MAWTTPMTAVAGTGLTAAQWNASVRDNLLETAPAKATESGSYFVGTDANEIAERVIGFQSITTQETTTSGSYTDLATVGPTVTVTSGARALAILSASGANTTANTSCNTGLDLSGATTSSAQDSQSIHVTIADPNDTYRCSLVELYSVTPGSNTFTAKYRVSGGTGTFGARRVIVMPY